MAEKKVAGFIKLQIPAGAANPAPPVGPALGAQGVNIMQFCQAFNAATQDQSGTIIPVQRPRFTRTRVSPSCARPLRRPGSNEGEAGHQERTGISELKAVGTLSLDELRENRRRISSPNLTLTTSKLLWRLSLAPLAPWVCVSRVAR